MLKKNSPDLHRAPDAGHVIAGSSIASSRGPVAVRLAAFALATALCGCAWVGPEIVRTGRPAYNDAILATSDQQLLQNIVRMRFVDSIGFLAVSSVTANVSVTASGTVQLGAGPTSNYAGNLVPIAGTVSTEQNPTISYTPVPGDHLLRQFAAEVPLDLAILMVNAAHSHGQAWWAIVRRVNNLRNPDFPDPPTLVVDPGFAEVVALAGQLQRRGELYWVRLAGAQKGHAIVLHSYSPTRSREVARLLELLGIAKPEHDDRDIVIPVELSVGRPAPGSIYIETRSLLELMRLAAASVELPPNTYGAARFPPSGPAGRGIRIHSSTTAPSRPRVAVQYRDRWYWIDDDDDTSKQWFSMLQALVAAELPGGLAGTAPVLTIPVTGRR
jgi:hypothetical protein